MGFTGGLSHHDPPTDLIRNNSYKNMKEETKKETEIIVKDLPEAAIRELPLVVELPEGARTFTSI